MNLDAVGPVPIEEDCPDILRASVVCGPRDYGTALPGEHRIAMARVGKIHPDSIRDAKRRFK